MIRSPLVVTKQTPLARNGMVAAEHWRGAEVGAGILARGGNAVDAAVATAFAMTVVEPFMSTIAGSGTMLVHLARKGETVALNFNGVAPLAGHETLYKVVGGVSDGLFSWPRTENCGQRVRPPRGGRARLGGRTEPGARALRHDGAARCHGAGHRAGARRLRDGLVPGAQPRPSPSRSWSAFPVTASNYLRDGRYIYRPAGMLPGDRSTYPDLARSLQLIAKDGPDAFYRGAIAQAIATTWRPTAASSRARTSPATRCWSSPC